MNSSDRGGPVLGALVAGVDGSEPAMRAVLWASEEARRRDRPLHLVYAADTDSRMIYASMETIEQVRNAGRDLLEETAAMVSERYPGLKVTKELSRREPVVSLHTAAGNHGTIVVGNRGLGGFNSLLLGSVGLKVAAGARTPVVVVRGAEGAPAADVVVAAIHDEHDVDFARHAASEAELRKASLRLVHVWNVLESVGNVVTMLDAVDEMARNHVRTLMGVTDRIRADFPGLTVEADAEKSMSAAGVLVEATRHADLLIMGGRRSPGNFGPTLGRVTHSLLHHANCPVELIPRQGKPTTGESQ
ncbi:universal stress protein [Streptomyces sp. NBC_00841]|uniref:universal stress protein n=1 Tax=unclassified Streptomyces TaxID=2593676 RepID=UPI002258E5D9|nr:MULTISPECIES: universal stress protein [unclassified Streptomyces]MCX4530577.1 universal stress protein [Streptomyces sp. NBC_01669]WSA03669.1 universal stress protein [Streptomyces sp. NBC_00841]